MCRFLSDASIVKGLRADPCQRVRARGSSRESLRLPFEHRIDTRRELETAHSGPGDRPRGRRVRSRVRRIGGRRVVAPPSLGRRGPRLRPRSVRVRRRLLRHVARQLLRLARRRSDVGASRVGAGLSRVLRHRDHRGSRAVPGRLWAAVAGELSGGRVVVSDDRGATWKTLLQCSSSSIACPRPNASRSCSTTCSPCHLTTSARS